MPTLRCVHDGDDGREGIETNLSACHHCWIAGGALMTRRAQRYREAARLIESGQEELCCPALKRVGLSSRELVRWWLDDGNTPDVHWALDWAYDFGGDERRNHRILALCFLAAVAEA